MGQGNSENQELVGGLLERVIVVGGPGSGKSTLARWLSETLEVPHIELDALWWQPNWMPPRVDVFQQRLRSATNADRWIVSGNYLDTVSEMLWATADTLVWLDLSRHIGFLRTLRRTCWRLVQRRELWAGNRESVANLGPRSLIALARRWPNYPTQINALLTSGSFPALSVVRLRTSAEVRAWKARVRQAGHPGPMTRAT